MATFDIFRPAAPTSGAVSTLLGRLITWIEHRQTVAVLSKLTNRELEDIGLVRGDIGRYAYIARRGSRKG